MTSKLRIFSNHVSVTFKLDTISNALPLEVWQTNVKSYILYTKTTHLPMQNTKKKSSTEDVLSSNIRFRGKYGNCHTNIFEKFKTVPAHFSSLNIDFVKHNCNFDNFIGCQFQLYRMLIYSKIINRFKINSYFFCHTNTGALWVNGTNSGLGA